MGRDSLSLPDVLSALAVWHAERSADRHAAAHLSSRDGPACRVS